MQQRKSVAGRPSGTDGSDFSYRMLVDPRYTKVAQGKSRLRVLIIVQAFSLVIGMMWAALSALQEQALNTLSIVSVIIALVSLITGDLGRRRSSVNLLKLYLVSSSIATVLSVAHIVTSDLSFEALRDQNVPLLKKFEAVEAGCVLLGVLVQMFAIIITASLMQNMSPKRVS